MRIRQIKPDYWKDSRLHNTHGITADVREFYVGLWGIADDLGYFRWDVPEVASELYRYQTPHRRERNTAIWMERLVEIERVVLLDCGHGFIPRLAKHQKIGGTKSQTFLLEHQKCVPPQTSANSAEPPSPSVVVKGKGDGKERNGTESNGRPDERFENAMARAKAKAGVAA